MIATIMHERKISRSQLGFNYVEIVTYRPFINSFHRVHAALLTACVVASEEI